MFDKLCNTAIRESLNTELLLLQIEKSQLRWFGHVTRMSKGQLPKQTSYAKICKKWLIEWPQTRWIDYIEDLGWNRLGFHPSEMQSELVDQEIR